MFFSLTQALVFKNLNFNQSQCTREKTVDQWSLKSSFTVDYFLHFRHRTLHGERTFSSHTRSIHQFIPNTIYVFHIIFLYYYYYIIIKCSDRKHAHAFPKMKSGVQKGNWTLSWYSHKFTTISYLVIIWN